MTERNDFDMYSNYDDKIPIRKRNYKALRPNLEEFGVEETFNKVHSYNKESFSDWIDKMTKEHEK